MQSGDFGPEAPLKLGLVKRAASVRALCARVAYVVVYAATGSAAWLGELVQILR